SGLVGREVRSNADATNRDGLLNGWRHERLAIEKHPELLAHEPPRDVGQQGGAFSIELDQDPWAVGSRLEVQLRARNVRAGERLLDAVGAPASRDDPRHRAVEGSPLAKIQQRGRAQEGSNVIRIARRWDLND